ncbi:MAG: UPF0280 family protein [Candidatus Altiarchaeales archaeon]|nr:MAG: UPF0280 family protein [Candidatus Altiarchaeales archaeon]
MKKFKIRYKETGLFVLTDKDLKERIEKELIFHYNLLENYIRRNPLFLASYEPLTIEKDAPLIVKLMADSAKRAGVGPMASVAGTFSELIGNFILKNSKDVIVENGGDIFLKVTKQRVVGIFSGTSQFSERIGFRINPEETPLGICTSSGSVGHSISLGESDSVTVISKSCSLADASATAIGNCVKGENGIEKGIEKAKSIEGIDGVLIIKGEKMGMYGRLPEVIRTF